MRVLFGHRDSGFGRKMRAEVRPVSLDASAERFALTNWTPTKNGLYVRRTVSRRDFTKMAFAAVATMPLFQAGCEDLDDWLWALDVVKDIVNFADSVIGKYEARNTGENDTDVEVTTAALQSADKKEVDRIIQVASIPANGKTHEIFTPDANNGGLTAPEPGTYLLQGSIPVASAPIYSRRNYTVVA